MFPGLMDKLDRLLDLLGELVAELRRYNDRQGTGAGRE